MTFDWWTLAIQAVNFLILVWLLQRFLYKPVKDIIEQRRRIAEDALKASERAKAEAEETKARYDAQLAGIVAVRQKMLDEARQQIADEQRKLATDARARADEMIEAGHAEIAAEKETAVSELQNQIVELGTEIAANLLKKTSAKLPDEVYLNLLDEEIKALPERDLKKLTADLAGDTAALTVVTTHSLSSAKQKEWRKKLHTTLGPSAQIAFQTNEDLIGGAELVFPHSNLTLSWSDELGRVKEQIVGKRKSS